MMDTKTCIKCNVEKPIGEFRKGRQCGACVNIYKKESREKNPFCAKWHAMMLRCYSPKDNRYYCYGGRGITVCERWHIYENYKVDMEALGPKPTPKHSMDRIDNDGNYEPCNVRWADPVTQGLNRRHPLGTTGVRGVYWRQEVRRFVVGVRIGKQKRKGLGSFHTLEEAVAVRTAWLIEHGETA